MPLLRTYNLFISHSWAYGDAYENLVKLLNAALNFTYRNYSVPEDDPIYGANTDSQLRAAIKRQMDCASVVLILAGVYATYSKWINQEIELAKSYNPTKKIIAIAPWGAERISTPVRVNANEIVRWSTSSIVDAIRRLA